MSLGKGEEKFIRLIKQAGLRFPVYNKTMIAIYVLMLFDEKMTLNSAKYVKQIPIIFDLFATDQV